MPNFKAKKIKDISLPIKVGETEFVFKTKAQLGKTLVYTSIENASFFIEINEKNNEFVIKIDKLTKITDLALMQKALESFEKTFCEEIISRAYHYNQFKELAGNVITSTNDFKELINSLDNVYLEIGFGSGRHLLYQASNNPQNTYIGIEIHKPSLIQVSKLAKDLKNIYLLDFDARIAIKELKESSLNGIFLHFPVPWDDAPYRRVVSNEFKNECLRVLKEGAFFELRSDSLMYAKYTKEIFGDLDYDYFKNKDARIISKYESRWLKMNKDIYDFVCYVKNKKNLKQELQNQKIEFIIDFNKLDFIKHIDKDFFVKISRIYDSKNAKIIQLAYGGFDTPSSSYILCENNKEFKILFHDFCPNALNIKAFNKLKEFLE